MQATERKNSVVSNSKSHELALCFIWFGFFSPTLKPDLYSTTEIQFLWNIWRIFSCYLKEAVMAIVLIEWKSFGDDRDLKMKDPKTAPGNILEGSAVWEELRRSSAVIIMWKQWTGVEIFRVRIWLQFPSVTRGKVISVFWIGWCSKACKSREKRLSDTWNMSKCWVEKGKENFKW